MSLVRQHIRALRAEAAALADVSGETQTVAVAHLLMGHGGCKKPGGRCARGGRESAAR
jgi:hypothetical protein